ncbi:unnamed protein product, partial [Laminaria digitata]
VRNSPSRYENLGVSAYETIALALWLRRSENSTPILRTRPICAGAASTKLCAECGSYWSRLTFRPPGFSGEKRHQNTRQDCPCRPRAPQRVGVRVRVRVRSGVELARADVQG